MKKDYFVAQEDTNIYNVFSVDNFDDDGFLVGHENDDGYHRSALRGNGAQALAVFKHRMY